MFNPRNLLLSLALSAFAASASAGSLVYVENGFQFGTVDLASGAFTPIGPGTPEGVTGLAAAPNGSLLTLSFSGDLESINPANGAVTIVGATGLGDCSLLSSPCGPTSANTIAALGGKIYATDYQNKLYTVNPVTGATTPIGLTGMPGITFVPLSTNADGSFNIFDEALFAADGKLFATFDTGAVDILTSNPMLTPVIDAKLYEIDPATGVATLIGPTAFGLGAAVEVNGTTYAFNAPLGEVDALDLATGKTTFVSNLDPAAGIITGAAPTPEPASIALAAIGIIGFAVCRRRRHA
jgi:outer membrane protein assembly factor BamB